MNPDLKNVHAYMRDLALGALAHANWHVNYSHENRWTPELSVLQAAHAGELFIKARIAQEHPLLIFEQLPRKSESTDGRLDFKDLFENGRTVQFFELPALLWAATGIELPDRTHYVAFGKLRNAIQHFAPPQRVDVTAETRRFIYGVLDPFIHECWGDFAIDCNEDQEPYIYLMKGLVRKQVLFLVSPAAAESFDECENELSEASAPYQEEMRARIERAKKEHS